MQEANHQKKDQHSFYARKQELLQRVLAIAILSVCLASICHMGGSVKNGAS